MAVEKISLDQIAIEITRKCNMNPVCGHCFRGMPQNVDLSVEAIDNLLDQVSHIGKMMIAGGEPFLRIDTIKHIFEKIIENKIIVDYFTTTTNGLVFNDDLVQLFSDWNDFFEAEMQYGIGTDKNHFGIRINVSVDRFHNNEHGNTFLSLCNKSLGHLPHITITKLYDGGIVFKHGNAETLPEAIQRPSAPAQVIRCTEIPSAILDPLYLSATGILYDESANDEYNVADKLEPICDLNTSIDVFPAVKRYNVGKIGGVQAIEEMKKSLTAEQYDEFVLAVSELYEINHVLNNRGALALGDETAVALDRRVTALQKEYPHMNLHEAVAITVLKDWAKMFRGEDIEIDIMSLVYQTEAMCKKRAGQVTDFPSTVTYRDLKNYLDAFLKAFRTVHTTN